MKLNKISNLQNMSLYFFKILRYACAWEKSADIFYDYCADEKQEALIISVVSAEQIIQYSQNKHIPAEKKIGYLNGECTIPSTAPEMLALKNKPSFKIAILDPAEIDLRTESGFFQVYATHISANAGLVNLPAVMYFCNCYDRKGKNFLGIPPETELNIENFLRANNKDVYDSI